MLKGGSLKLVDKFTYLRSSISSMESNINTWLAKVWTAVDRLSIICRSDLSEKIGCNFFQVVVASILLYGCTTWTLTKHREKKLDGNYTRILQAVLNKSWMQYPQRSSYTAISLPSLKPSKFNKQDMQDTAGEVRTNS